MDLTVYTTKDTETRAWGRRLGLLLSGGDVVTLIGDLGAGKTAFAQGVGEGMGVRETMTSPTFTLMQEYAGEGTKADLRLIHMDLYRLRHPDEVEAIGMEDAFQGNTVCLIEWPEIAMDFLPADCLSVTILGSGEERRTLTFRAESEGWRERLNRLKEEGQ